MTTDSKGGNVDVRTCTSTNLVDGALHEAGLDQILDARRAGASIEAHRERLTTLDLVLVGALADRIRAEEVGIAVHLGDLTPAVEPFVVPVTSDRSELRGLVFLRAVAFARIFGAKGARVVVDWSSAGIELAQVALSFGANELVGPVLSRRGLPIADDRTKKVKGQGQVSLVSLKKQELADLVRRVGREPTWSDEVASLDSSPMPTFSEISP